MNPINSTDGHEIKKSIIKILVGLSKTDDNISDKELLFILDAAKTLNFTEEYVNTLINEANQVEIVIPKLEQERMSIIYYLLFLSKQDGQLNLAEENYIFHYGFKLGFNEAMLREMVGIFKEKHSQAIAPEELLAIIKKYLN